MLLRYGFCAVRRGAHFKRKRLLRQDNRKSSKILPGMHGSFFHIIWHFQCASDKILIRQLTLFRQKKRRVRLNRNGEIAPLIPVQLQALPAVAGDLLE